MEPVAEMQRKRRDYFTSGVQLLWVINRIQRTVLIYTDAETLTAKAANDLLDGGAVLPGFKLPITDIFDPLDQWTRPQ